MHQSSKTPFFTLYSINEVCSQLSLSRASLYRLINRGEIEAVKKGRNTRISGQSLEEYIHKLPRLNGSFSKGVFRKGEY